MTAYVIDRHASGHRFDTERRWAALELGFEPTPSEPAPVTRLVRRRHRPLRVQRLLPGGNRLPLCVPAASRVAW